MCNHHDKLRSNNVDLKHIEKQLDRRDFFKKTSLGLGAIALGSLLKTEKLWSTVNPMADLSDKVGTFSKNKLGLPHHLPKAKRVVYLFQSGGPSQIDLFDYKPKLQDMFGQDLPDSIRAGQRLTGMSADQTAFPIAASTLNFKQYGESRAWVSDAMPFLSEVVDDLCFIKSMHTDHINPRHYFFSNRKSTTR